MKAKLCLTVFAFVFAQAFFMSVYASKSYAKKEISPILSSLLLSDHTVTADAGLRVTQTNTEWIVETTGEQGLEGLKMIIPKDSLMSDVKISANECVLETALPGDFESTYSTLSFGPNKTVFKNNIFIYVPYQDDNDDGIVDGTSIPVNNLEIKYLNEDTHQWERINQVGIDSKNKYIIGETNHFSQYAFGGSNDTRKLPFDDWVNGPLFSNVTQSDITERVEKWQDNYIPITFWRQPGRTRVTFVPKMDNNDFKVEYVYDADPVTYSAKEDFVRAGTVNNKKFEQIFYAGYDSIFGKSSIDSIWLRDGRKNQDFDNATVEILAWNPDVAKPGLSDDIHHALNDFIIGKVTDILLDLAFDNLAAPAAWLGTIREFQKVLAYIMDNKNPIVGIKIAGAYPKIVKHKSGSYHSIDIDSRLLKTTPVVLLDFIKYGSRFYNLSTANRDLDCYTSYGYKPKLIGRIYNQDEALLSWDEVRQLPDGRFFIVWPKDDYILDIPSQEIIDSYGDTIYGTSEAWLGCNIHANVLEENQAVLLKIDDWLEEEEFGTVVSAGQTWMDRNLGASRVAISKTDSSAYGYYYQWGRGNDGHQYSNSSETSILSNSDNPGHTNFIISDSQPYDWRSPQNNDLWQGVTGVNNPCPYGFRVPTETELNTERASWSTNNADGAFASPLKLVKADKRDYHSGYISQPNDRGLYWSSTFYSYSISASMGLYFGDDHSQMTSGLQRADACSVRCIKD